MHSRMRDFGYRLGSLRLRRFARTDVTDASISVESPAFVASCEKLRSNSGITEELRWVDDAYDCS